MRSWRRVTCSSLLAPALAAAAVAWTASPAPAVLQPCLRARTVSWTETTGDRTQLAAAQPAVTFGPVQPTDYAWSAISVDDARRFQKVQGMGAALTESSAVLIDRLPATDRARVLQQLFNPVTGAGISVLRVPLGASDFSLSDYTFDDMPWGKTDPTLAHFSIDRDRSHLLPIILAARKINPALTVIATPWSAPAWMKTNVNTHGGQLAPASEDAYARYLTRAVAEYRAAGAPVTALTVVNEPKASPGYSPSMTMSADQQARLVGALLRPRLDAAGLARWPSWATTTTGTTRRTRRRC